MELFLKINQETRFDAIEERRRRLEKISKEESNELVSIGDLTTSTNSNETFIKITMK